MRDKVNMEETNTVWPQSLQKDALLWMDVTLNTSYNKCHECMSPMNKCRATGRRKYAFPDPCVIVFVFHVVICTTTSHNIGHSCC